ncbi:MAG: MFS transporter [Propionibacteriaceae bacterium]
MTTTAAPITQAPVKQATAPGDMSHKQILQAMTGLLAGLFTALLSSTIVATALPTIIGDLHGTQRQYTWVITAALLATTVTTPIWGKLSDLFNKKLLVQLSLVVFVLGSIGAGASHTVPFLIGMRVIQGLGMGGLTALVQSIMGSIVAPRERGRYSGYMGAVMAVSTVSGPLLGGVIVDSPLGWRWCFYVCIPLAIIAIIILQTQLKLHTIPRKPKIDYLGAILISIGASLPLLWITFAGNDFDWISWQTAAYLVPAAIVVAIFVAVELRAPEPMVPIRVMANRTATLVIIASVAVGIAMFGGTTFLGQYFQIARGYSPTHAGLLTIPLMVSLLISSTLAGNIISKTGRWKRFLVGGAILLVAGLAGLGTIDHTTSLLLMSGYMALMGLGMGALMQNLVLAVQNTVDVRDIGAASATVAFFRSLGGAVGVSVLGAVLATQVADKVTAGLQQLGVPAGSAGASGSLDLTQLPAPVVQIVRAAYGDATGYLFLIAAVVAVVSLVCVLFIREVPLRTTVGISDAAKGAEASAAVASGAEANQFESADEPDLEINQVKSNGSTSHKVEPRRIVVGTPTMQDLDSLDDPEQRMSVAALDVLTAAQDQARQHLNASQHVHVDVVAQVDELARQIDAAVAGFHAELEQIKARLQSTDSGASINRDGVGGDSIRSYEYGLLLNSQQTADRVVKLARAEAERILTNADAEVAQREQRIEKLRAAEAELQTQVSERLRTHGA